MQVNSIPALVAIQDQAQRLHRNANERKRRATMAYDITVVIDDLPGTLAKVGEVLGNAGVNIEGYCSFPSGGKSYLHVLLQEVTDARRVLTENGIEIAEEREVITLDMEDLPGAMGKKARLVADAGINIHMVYMGTNSRLVIVAYDLDNAKAALGI